MRISKNPNTRRRGECRTEAAFTQQSWHFLNGFEGRGAQRWEIPGRDKHEFLEEI